MSDIPKPVLVILLLALIMGATALGLDVAGMLSQTEDALDVVEQLDDLAEEPAPEPAPVVEEESPEDEGLAPDAG